MTVLELTNAINFPEGYSFKYTTEFDAYNALVDGSKEIENLIDKHITKGEMDWDEFFNLVINFDYKEDTLESVGERYNIDYDIVLSKLKVNAIYENPKYGGIVLEVEYID